MDANGNDVKNVSTLDADEALIGGGAGIRISREADVTFYVDQANGDDANDGKSASAAFASYERALEEVPRFGDTQVEIRQIGDYTASSPVEIENRRGSTSLSGGYSVKIVGDSELDPLNGNGPADMETFDGVLAINGSTAVRIDSLNINGLFRVFNTTTVLIYQCYLEGDSNYFVYFRGSLCHFLNNVFDGQSNNPNNGILGVRSGKASFSSRHEIRNWDYQNNNFYYIFSGAKAIDGLDDKYPDAGRRGDVVPTEGRGIADEAFNRDLEGKRLSNVGSAVLPSGASVAEDNGDFVIKDSSGSIVLRRNESANEWQLEGGDLTDIGALNAESAETTTSYTDPSGQTYTGLVGGLAAAGYEKGDYVPLVYGSGTNTGSGATTSGTYVGAYNNGIGAISWSDIAPSAGTLAVWFYGRVGDLNGTTMDVRVINAKDNETMVERTGLSSSGIFKISPTEYTPPSSDIIQYRTEIRSGDGSSQVRLYDGSITIGVQL